MELSNSPNQLALVECQDAVPWDWARQRLARALRRRPLKAGAQPSSAEAIRRLARAQARSGQPWSPFSRWPPSALSSTASSNQGASGRRARGLRNDAPRWTLPARSVPSRDLYEPAHLHSARNKHCRVLVARRSAEPGVWGNVGRLGGQPGADNCAHGVRHGSVPQGGHAQVRACELASLLVSGAVRWQSGTDKTDSRACFQPQQNKRREVGPQATGDLRRHAFLALGAGARPWAVRGRLNVGRSLKRWLQVCGLTMTVGLDDGFGEVRMVAGAARQKPPLTLPACRRVQPLFAACAVFALIVMYDAAGVRLHAGRQAEVLNQIITELPPQHPVRGVSPRPPGISPRCLTLSGVRVHPLSDTRPLREMLGHTQVQVAAGGLLGALVALTRCSLAWHAG